MIYPFFNSRRFSSDFFNSLVNIFKTFFFLLMSHNFLFLALTNHSFSFPFSRLTLNVIGPTQKRQPSEIFSENLKKNCDVKVATPFLIIIFSSILPIG